MTRQVKIPVELFMDLCRFHLADLREADVETRIRAGLSEKLDQAIDRDAYSRSKMAATPAEREAARQEYLDRKGIPAAYRWGPDGPT